MFLSKLHNKRGIRGSLIWINFDRHALLNVFRKARARFVANVDDIRPQFRPDTQTFLDQTAIFNTALTRTVGGPVSNTIDNLDNIPLDEVSSLKELAAPWYADQVLPFQVEKRAPILGHERSLNPLARRAHGLETVSLRSSNPVSRPRQLWASKAGCRFPLLPPSARGW